MEGAVLYFLLTRQHKILQIVLPCFQEMLVKRIGKCMFFIVSFLLPFLRANFSKGDE